MLKNNRLVLIGGTGRNVGKTEFVCRLITNLTGRYTVYGLKVSSIYPDETIFHGDHDLDNRRLFEETNRHSKKDTARMLRAGAEKVFYLQGEDDKIRQDYLRFSELVPEGSVVVCESNSLGNHVIPALHIVVTSKSKPVKPRAVKLLEIADVIIDSDGQGGFPEIETISASLDMQWSPCEQNKPRDEKR